MRRPRTIAMIRCRFMPIDSRGVDVYLWPDWIGRADLFDPERRQPRTFNSHVF